jgi:hypothetical protein
LSRAESSAYSPERTDDAIENGNDGLAGPREQVVQGVLFAEEVDCVVPLVAGLCILYEGDDVASRAKGSALSLEDNGGGVRGGMVSLFGGEVGR